MEKVKKEDIFNIFYEKEKWDIWKKFQIIEKSIDTSNELYDYFDEIKELLYNEKSYIQMRGFRIICKLSKWDKDNKINEIIDDLLLVLESEKPSIVRMCLELTKELILNKKELNSKIKRKLLNLDLSKYKDTMYPLIKKDIESICNIMEN